MSDVSSFAYRAARPNGLQEIGVVEAPTRDAAVAELVARGLFPIEVWRDSQHDSLRTSLSPAELALGLRMLATLLESGLSLPRALGAMEDLAPEGWRAGLASVREAVRRGNGLATALRSASLGIPEVVIGIIQAGEAGSGLASAMGRAADLAESMASIRAAVRSALAYPFVLAAAGILSVCLLVGVVIPRFAAILADLGQVVPATTRIVLGLAELVRDGAIPAMIAIGLAIVAWRAWTARESGREQWHALLLSLPIVGEIRRSSATARVCAATAALLESGVSIVPALEHAAATAGDAAIAARLDRARQALIGGHALARALAEADAMTPTAVRLVRTGEETGRLSAMLAHAARVETERAERTVRTAVRLLEPTLIVVFAGIISLVAAALLQAVYGVKVEP